LSVHGQLSWLNHLQFSPTDPKLLMYCHEGPWHKLHRIWLIDVETRSIRKVHERTVDREIAGHEFWSPDGRTIWFDLQTGCMLAAFAGVDQSTIRAIE
jgi:oligogalacturonide lyase